MELPGIGLTCNAPSITDRMRFALNTQNMQANMHAVGKVLAGKSCAPRRTRDVTLGPDCSARSPQFSQVF